MVFYVINHEQIGLCKELIVYKVHVLGSEVGRINLNKLGKIQKCIEAKK